MKKRKAKLTYTSSANDTYSVFPAQCWTLGEYTLTVSPPYKTSSPILYHASADTFPELIIYNQGCFFFFPVKDLTIAVYIIIIQNPPLMPVDVKI